MDNYKRTSTANYNRALTSYLSMLLKKHMLTDPIVFEIIISQNLNYLSG